MAPAKPEYTLTRFVPNGMTADGTIGRFLQWVTLEDDWLDNRSKVSCIPTGRYLCKRTVYVKGGYPTFEITGVPNRSRILIHAGNTEEDIEGCVLLGLKLGVLEKVDEDTGEKRWKLAALGSRKAHDEFMHTFEGVAEFWLNVEDY